MTENSIASVPLPQQESQIATDSDKQNPKLSRNSPEREPDPTNKSLCTEPSTECHVTFKAQTDDGNTSTSACPSNVPYQQTELSATATERTEQAELCESVAPARSLASEVLEKARTRFDMFWGKSKPNPEDSNQ